MEFDFRSKVAVVTGGGSGIGRAICLEFARSGASVVCVDRDAKSGAETVGMIQEQRQPAVFVQADVTQSDDVQRYVKESLGKFGRIDIFANNAGYEGVVRPLADYPDEVFDQVIAVNVKGVFLGLKHVLPVMVQQRGGAVINTGSIASHSGAIGVCAYTASKHAVLGLTRTAALEVARHGVRVNAVCPGSTQTRMLDSLLSARESDTELAMQFGTPNGRVAAPAEIAAAVAFLASDQAVNIVGQYLVIDGGRLAM